MKKAEKALLYEELTYELIGAAMTVHPQAPYRVGAKVIEPIRAISEIGG